MYCWCICSTRARGTERSPATSAKSIHSFCLLLRWGFVVGIRGEFFSSCPAVCYLRPCMRQWGAQSDSQPSAKQRVHIMHPLLPHNLLEDNLRHGIWVIPPERHPINIFIICSLFALSLDGRPSRNRALLLLLLLPNYRHNSSM